MDAENKVYRKMMFSSENQEAKTPPEVWQKIHTEFGDDVFDPCPENPTVDGLSIPWKDVNYVNPPYKECNEWMNKCVQEFIHGKKIVALIPARTNTSWFHRWVLPYATEIRFVKNGVKFVGYKRKSPFPICLVIYDPKKKGTQTFCSIDFYNKKPLFIATTGNKKRKLNVAKTTTSD